MSAEQKEQLRHVILEVLAVRHPVALPLRAIRRLAAPEVDFALQLNDVEAQCVFLVGLKHLRGANDALGATTYFAATSEGVLEYERGVKPKPN